MSRENEVSNRSRVYRFLFRPVDARVYALFRIAFAFAVFFNWLQLASYRIDLFSDHGMIDQGFVAKLCQGEPYFSLFHHFDSLSAVNWIFALAGVAILFIGIGLLTRLSVLLVYLWQLSYINAIFPVLSGWDALLTIYTFLLLIAPATDLWSVDGWLKRKWFNKQPCETAPAYGLYLMRFQLALIYFSTVILKLYDYYWLNGDFFGYFMFSAYSRFPNTVFAEYQWLSALLTYGTLVIELMLPFFLFSRKLRWLGFFLGFTLHLSIMVSSNLFVFSFAMLTLYIPFLNHLEDISKILQLKSTTSSVKKIAI